MVNELHLGYQGFFQIAAAEEHLNGQDSIKTFGIRGLSHASVPGLIGSPVMNITGFSSFGNGGGPNRARNHTFQPLEMLSFNKGRHFM